MCATPQTKTTLQTLCWMAIELNISGKHLRSCILHCLRKIISLSWIYRRVLWKPVWCTASEMHQRNDVWNIKSNLMWSITKNKEKHETRGPHNPPNRHPTTGRSTPKTVSPSRTWGLGSALTMQTRCCVNFDVVCKNAWNLRKYLTSMYSIYGQFWALDFNQAHAINVIDVICREKGTKT